MEKISVIVPIYNVESYLIKCIESIRNQIYRNLEIILVDDESPDYCGEICDMYAKKDPRIRVIHKKNSGLGEARNTGLEVATGEYIYFVDSDDWLEKEMIQKLYETMKRNSADFVMCGFKKCKSDGNEVVHRYVQQEKKVQNKEVQKKLFLPMIGQTSLSKEDYTINMCVWTNLYRRDIIEKYNIRFFSEKKYLSEDICFNLQYLLHTNCAIILPDVFYCYRSNPNSLTCSYKEKEYEMLVRLYEQVSKLANQTIVFNELEFRKERFFITKVREILFRLANSSLNWKERKRICKEILEDETLQIVLKEYPLRRYKMKYRIPAYMMKFRCTTGTLLLFYIIYHIRRYRGGR